MKYSKLLREQYQLATIPLCKYWFSYSRDRDNLLSMATALAKARRIREYITESGKLNVFWHLAVGTADFPSIYSLGRIPKCYSIA